METIMDIIPFISIVIPTHNRREKLTRLVESIIGSAYPQENIEIVIVDDASTDGTFVSIQSKFPEIRILRNQSERFPSECRNIGIKKSRGDFVFFLDDDNVIDENTINELVNSTVKYRGVGLVGPIAYYEKTPEKIFCAGGKLQYPLLIPANMLQGNNKKDVVDEVIQCDYVPNAFMVKKDILEHVGFFDERFSIGWEEADFAWRLRKRGLRIIVLTRAKVFHDVPFTQDIHVTETRAYWRGRGRVLFYRKHFPLRSLFIFLDIIGFSILLLKLKVNVRTCFSQYLKGVKDGLTFAGGF
jgi:GT2 family glycosyltransferase